MTTSGTTNFNLTTDDLIVQAYERLGSGDISGFDLKNGKTATEMLLIDLQNRDVLIWKMSLRTLPITPLKDSFTLPTGVDGVIDVVLKDSNDVEVPLTRLSLVEFNRISKKNQESRPSQYTVQRNRDSVTLKIWPLAPDNSYTLQYWSVDRVEDVGNLRNTLDLSYRFIPAFIYGLAFHLSFTKPGVDPNYRVSLKQEFEEHLLRARDDYRERVSWKFKPKLNRSRC